MASSTREVLTLRLDDEESGRTYSKGLGSSAEGVVTVSLKRSKDAATLRPIPADCGGPVRLGLEVDEEVEAELDRRGRVTREGENTSSGGLGLETGRVRDLSDLRWGRRLRDLVGETRACFVSVSEPSESEWKGWDHLTG